MLATVPRLKAKFIVMNMFYCSTSMFYVVMSWLLKSFLDTEKLIVALTTVFVRHEVRCIIGQDTEGQLVSEMCSPRL